MLNYIIWDWNPEIFSLGFLQIRYYGLLFAGGFLIGYYFLKRLFKKEGTDIAWLDAMLMYVMVGTVVGARLGHCLFYEPSHYLSHPIDILKVWEGGLASHGGAVGILIALWIYSRKVTKKSMLWSLDRLVIVVALAGCMIRLGNLANSEIYGHSTEKSWGFVHVRDSDLGRSLKNEQIVHFLEHYSFQKEEKQNGKDRATLTLEFNRHVKSEQEARALAEFRLKPRLRDYQSKDGSPANLYMESHEEIVYSQKGGHYFASIPLIVRPKHPTHIYEASCYLLTFFLLLFIYSQGGLKRRGFIFGIFLICVFGSRFFIEIIKENQVAAEIGRTLNTGQKLSIPFVLAGFFFIFRAFLPQKTHGALPKTKESNN